MSAPTARVGGRVLLLDDADRVLLVHERVEDGTHWLTPGGGLEPGELPWQAASREAFEETGLVVDLGPDPVEVLRTRRLWSWRELTFDQVDHFFLARVPSGLPVVPQALTDVEAQTLIGHAWWSLDQLRATSEVVVPPDLADVLAELVGARRPPA